jgi:hypothetical protein
MPDRLYCVYGIEQSSAARLRLHAVYALMLRRLEDRIRELCARTLVVSGSELEQIFLELKSALHEHTERLRITAAVKLVRRENDGPPERRSA